jgi:hypothetical protein
VGGGTPCQATCGTCRLGQCRQGGAATAIAGMWPGNVVANGRYGQVGHAASPTAGRVTWRPTATPVADTSLPLLHRQPTTLQKESQALIPTWH